MHPRFAYLLKPSAGLLSCYSNPYHRCRDSLNEQADMFSGVAGLFSCISKLKNSFADLLNRSGGPQGGYADMKYHSADLQNG
jgi:hypothetical protein